MFPRIKPMRLRLVKEPLLPENWSIILHAFAFRGVALLVGLSRGAMREARIDDRISGSLGLKP